MHWNRFNVPAHGNVAIAAGQQLSGDVGQTSGWGRGYEGMCPPDAVHTYRFAVFASRDKLQVDTRKPWTIDAFEAKYGNQVLAKAQVTGKFWRGRACSRTVAKKPRPIAASHSTVRG